MPLFIYEVAVGRTWLASFVTLWFVAAMDCLDGYLARKLNQVTRIGTWLDPMVDRVVILTAAVTMALTGLMPLWLIVAVGLRDICIGFLGGMIYRSRTIIKVTWIGKIGTLLPLFGIPGFLLSHVSFTGQIVLERITWAQVILALPFYYVSLLQYLSMALLGRSHV